MVKNRYIYFIELFSEKNIEVYICRDIKKYLWRNTFESWYQYDFTGKTFHTVNEEIRGDYIYDKSWWHFLSDLIHPELKEICANKYSTYWALNKEHIKTFLIKTENDLKKFLSQQPENMLIVTKPVKGSRWENIFVWYPSQIQDNIAEFPTLIQKYIDSSLWIEKICDGIHDLRFIIHNGKIIYCGLREPKKWELIVKWWQWIKSISLDTIPWHISKFVEKIDKKFNIYKNRLYSIDIMNSDIWLQVIEMNSNPWIPVESWLYEIIADKIEKDIKKMGV